MAELKLGQDFTPTEGVTEPPEEGVEQTPSKQAAVAPAEEEKETPSEPPAEEKPAGEPSADIGDASALQKTVQSLQEERVKLLRDLADLRGQRRELKQEQIAKVDAALSELKDVHPEDVAVIEKVLRSKGYIRKDEAQTMFYESVKNEELNKFLAKYPEYKPENDPNDLNWSRLQKELGFYRMPENPHFVADVLERAHRAISGASVSGDRSTEQKKRQLEVAGVGSGGAQRSSSGVNKTLDPTKRGILERGGWSEEEIKKIESRLE